jgi:hypothetical protein
LTIYGKYQNLNEIIAGLIGFADPSNHKFR